MAWSCLASVCLVRVKAVPATRATAVIRANVDTTPHRDGYRGGGAARDRAADGTAEANAAGEAPGTAGPDRVLSRPRSLLKSHAFCAGHGLTLAHGRGTAAEQLPS